MATPSSERASDAPRSTQSTLNSSRPSGGLPLGAGLGEPRFASGGGGEAEVVGEDLPRHRRRARATAAPVLHEHGEGDRRLLDGGEGQEQGGGPELALRWRLLRKGR